MFGQNTVTSTWGNNQQSQPQGTTGFGQPSGFGTSNGNFRILSSFSPLILGLAFGSTNTFGQQPQNQPTNSIFGNTSNPSGTSGFGACAYSSFCSIFISV
jgi:hypothetical protein